MRRQRRLSAIRLRRDDQLRWEAFRPKDGPRDVDDALDAAGAPHHDERGTLSTAQRVAWLASDRRGAIAASEQEWIDRVRAAETNGQQTRERLAKVAKEREAAQRALFDVAIALEAADGGASGTYENGPPRIRAIADERDKWRACAQQAQKRVALLEDSAPLDAALDQRDVAESHAILNRAGVAPEGAGSDGRVGKLRVAARIARLLDDLDRVKREARESLKRTGYDRERLADQVRGIAAGLTYNDTPPEGAAKALLYELSSHMRSGCQRHPVSEATKPLHQRIEQLETELRALGLSIENARTALADAGVTGSETLARGVRQLAAKVPPKGGITLVIDLSPELKAAAELAKVDLGALASVAREFRDHDECNNGVDLRLACGRKLARLALEASAT